ncbi:hypothetical protein [Nocardiopsis sp. HUAS JQ3]|uniref:hypothetical protein n=1 Tax=Nocardiopsis sp. HUAS JQ3 TaxID=3061629 RepID=UPI0023A9E8BF|nr:hypothetical protein [Nocardiopsis sp. HUAS JQ3]WDZ90323.1 hypothetical protein PV789_26075 [Nocardiopsis sp. HUAS JQ3]
MAAERAHGGVRGAADGTRDVHRDARGAAGNARGANGALLHTPGDRNPAAPSDARNRREHP